LCTELT